MFSPSQNSYERPQSSGNMSDLHIYVVPTELWDEQQNLAFNQIINETISAGFIRVNADMFIFDLRIEIEHQLGYEVIPKDYVFCKSVGRCMTQVRGKQEHILKVKHFLPPNSVSPELFVVDRQVAKHSETGSSRSKTFTPFSDRPYSNEQSSNSHTAGHISTNPNTSEIIEREEIDHEISSEDEQTKDYQKSKNNVFKQKDVIKKTDSKKDIFQEEEKKTIQESKIHEEHNEEKFQVKDNKDIALEPNHKSKTFKSDTGENIGNTKSLWNGNLESRRKEIDHLQKEIMKRYSALESLEKKHEENLAIWEANEEKRRKEETERRQLFEQIEKERREQEDMIINKQKEELNKLEELLKNKHEEINKLEVKLKEERESRKKIMEMKQKEINDLKTKLNSNTSQDHEGKVLEIQNELKDIEKKRKHLEDTTMTERAAAEDDFKKAQGEFENLRKQWEEEKKIRDQQYTERINKENRLRRLSDQKHSEHEKRMEEERQRMARERERFKQEQMHWEEERSRFEAEEKLRLQETDLAIQNAKENKPNFSKFEIKDPELVLEGASESEQIKYLHNILETTMKEREACERQREGAIKKIRASQMQVQNKRNQIRDMWKKRYFEEKRKTPPLEEQLNHYKEEIDNLNKSLLGFMESGFKEHTRFLKRNGIMSPSNKANIILQATRIQHDIDDLHQKIAQCQLKLSAEMKLRAQTETELKMLRVEAMQKKIRLSRTRSDQLSIMAAGNNALINSHEYTASPRNMMNFEV